MQIKLDHIHRWQWATQIMYYRLWQTTNRLCFKISGHLIHVTFIFHVYCGNWWIKYGCRWTTQIMYIDCDRRQIECFKISGHLIHASTLISCLYCGDCLLKSGCQRTTQIMCIDCESQSRQFDNVSKKSDIWYTFPRISRRLLIKINYHIIKQIWYINSQHTILYDLIWIFQPF